MTTGPADQVAAERRFTLGLCYGTVMDADFHGLVDAAAEAGFDTISVSPSLYHTARKEGHSDEALRRELRHRGIAVAVIDPLISPLPALPPFDKVSPFMQQLLSYTEADCFAAAEALGAPMVAVAHPAGGVVPHAALVDIIGSIASRAADRGMRIGVEFIANSQGIGTMPGALAIIRDIGLANVGVVFDAWHLFRTGVEMETLTEVPRSAIASIQLCDAPASAKAETPGILADRLIPGEGAIPLGAMLEALLKDRPGVDVAVEVFSSELRRLPPRQVAQRAADGVRKVLAGTQVG